MDNFDWNYYWTNIVKCNKLENKVSLLNQIDKKNNCIKKTEDICKSIYYSFPIIESNLKEIEKKTIVLLKDVKNIYLQTSRVKTVDSLIVKIINRRFKYMNLRNNKYNRIDDDNYIDVITDLVGVRLIVAHMGDWKEVHDQLLDIFPMKEEYIYSQTDLLERNKPAMQVILPHAYYLDGDDISLFEENDIVTEMSEKGYRSIHYVATFENIYLEIQLRPLFMEQWCMTSHNYVYKKEDYDYYNLLNNLSKILSGVTFLSGELGDFMKDIFENKYSIEKKGNLINMDLNGIEKVDKLIKICNNSVMELKNFRNRIQNDNEK